MIDVIAFDGDDTLWLNEIYYQQAQDKLGKILAPFVPESNVRELLYQTEKQNLPYYGYGIKSFTLSMIETAIRESNGSVTGQEVRQILDIARSMIRTEVQLIDDAASVVRELAGHHKLMLVTKGDLLDQERKLAQSGLLNHFAFIEIVSEKTPAIYRSILEKYRIPPHHFLMVGNSLKSDILPVLAIGERAVYVPHHFTWEHEKVDESDHNQDAYYTLAELGQLPVLIDRINGTD